MHPGKLDIVYTNTAVRSILLAAKIDGMVKGGGKHVHEPACSLGQVRAILTMALLTVAILTLAILTSAILTMAQVRTLTLETEKPARLMVDGDIIGATPLTVTILPGSFTLFTPESPAPS
mgnify:FL=1